MARQPFSIGQLSLAAVVLIVSAWQYHLAKGPIAEYPIPDYCGVGVCPTDLPNRFLPAPQQMPNNDPSPVLNAQLAVRLNPASPYVWADLAETAWRTGDLAKAQNCFEQALRSAPHNPSIRTRARVTLETNH